MENEQHMKEEHQTEERMEEHHRIHMEDHHMDICTGVHEKGINKRMMVVEGHRW